MNYDYLIYINNNNLLTNCQKKTLINYNNLKFKFYIETNSNYQMKFLFDNIYKNNNIEEVARFELLLLHFTDYSTLKYIIRQILKKKITDTDIINIISKKLYKHHRINNIYEVCNKWIYAIESLLLIYNNKNDNINYLDIGCGDAKKTQIFAKKLNLKNDNIYCTDIQAWGPYQKDKKNIPFQFEYIIDNKLNYSDNKFDLVTCILTLHHILDLDNFITEIYRIVKPGGYLLIIEHSVYTDYDRLLINIQHSLYSALHDKKTDYIKNPDYINCYNSYEFHHMMNKKNFILTDSNILVFNNEFKLKYDNIFYAFYKK
jgi:ubiquinone/menaquinone biosynthesis C-methylase UbiE